MAPRTPSQNQSLRDQSRDRILDGALRAFSRHGFDGASVRIVAKEAGVAQGLLYSHFQGKEDLLRAIFERGMRDVRESFQALEPSSPAPAAPASPAELRFGVPSPLEGLIRSAFAIVRRNLAFWKLTYGLRMQTAALESLGPGLDAWTREILGVLEAYFKSIKAALPRTEAALLFAAIDGIAQHFALDPKHYPLDAVADALIQRYRLSPDKNPPGGTHGKDTHRPRSQSARKRRA